MYTAIIALLAVSASSVIAAPLTQVVRAAPHARYAEGYLEPYDTYHARYLSIGCRGQQNTQFFDDCCRPLLSSQTTSDLASYCFDNSSSSTALASSTTSASASEVSSSATTDQSSAYSATPTSSSSPSASPSPSTSSGSDSGSGSYQYTGGFATFFYQGGNPGACGIVHDDSGLGIAIDQNGFWQNTGATSDHCGKYINIKNTNNGKTVTAQVWDVCPSCTNDHSLDLSVGAFQAIASESDGMVPIVWSFA